MFQSYQTKKTGARKDFVISADKEKWFRISDDTDVEKDWLAGLADEVFEKFLQ